MYRYSPATNIKEYQRVLKCLPLFNQNCNCMVFSLKDLQAPIIGFNNELSSIFTKLLEIEKDKQNKGTSFGSEVKQMIIKHFQFNFPQLEEVAEKMNLTPRSLQRKLKEEHTSFRYLSDSVKQELACTLLNNKRFSIADIAYKLGYAEPGTFQRAFKQWMGQSPNNFRQQSRPAG